MKKESSQHIPDFLKLANNVSIKIRYMEKLTHRNKEGHEAGSKISEEVISFMTNPYMPSTELTNDPRLQALGMVHALYRNLGIQFSELMKPPEEKNKSRSRDNIEEALKVYKECKELTLYFTDKNGNSVRIEIPNEEITVRPHTHYERRERLAAVLYVLGQAGDTIFKREHKDTLIIENMIGVAESIPENMGQVYRHLFEKLQEKGYAEHEAIELMQASKLDLNPHVVRVYMSKTASNGVKIH